MTGPALRSLPWHPPSRCYWVPLFPEALVLRQLSALDTFTSWPWALRGRLVVPAVHISYQDLLQSAAVGRVMLWVQCSSNSRRGDSFFRFAPAVSEISQTPQTRGICGQLSDPDSARIKKWGKWPCGHDSGIGTPADVVRAPQASSPSCPVCVLHPLQMFSPTQRRPCLTV